MPDRPTIAELRARTQPPEVRGRRNSEHWTADLYQRRLSPYLTRVLVGTSLTANAVTCLMILTGAAAGAALLVPGLVGAVLAAFLGQLQMLLDCSDGEVARWRGTSSAVGIFLDKVGHYTAEGLIPIALGVRADGGLDSIGGWTTLGALLSVLVLVNKALNDAVHVARAAAGLPGSRTGPRRPRRPWPGSDGSGRWCVSCRSTGSSTPSSSRCSPCWLRSSTPWAATSSGPGDWSRSCCRSPESRSPAISSRS